eukprot:GFYU01068485.1.p2 GENE.GFYU01068485.1~~GFYU01068485.1.p2  ORF type:complete len:119 (+),score=49.46 GFYU01068485.1:286-642(+)
MTDMHEELELNAKIYWDGAYEPGQYVVQMWGSDMDGEDFICGELPFAVFQHIRHPHHCPHKHDGVEASDTTPPAHTNADVEDATDSNVSSSADTTATATASAADATDEELEAHNQQLL